MKNNRMNMLNQNGIDTSRFFTLTANYDIPKGSTIDIQVNPVAEQIITDGYVKNSKLHRRWITAQYLRMLNSTSGWYSYLKYHYHYMYQLKMMIEEVRVLSILCEKDTETYMERCQFFTPVRIKTILHRYYEDVESYLNSLRIHTRRNGIKYIKVFHSGYVKVDDKDSRLLEPIRTLIAIIDEQYGYGDIYATLKVLEKKMVSIPDEHEKIKEWVDAFQYEGAYYTLMNLVKFHGCVIKENATYGRYRDYKGVDAVNYLKDNSLHSNEGYVWHALLKETIEYNNFDLATSISKGE